MSQLFYFKNEAGNECTLLLNLVGGGGGGDGGRNVILSFGIDASCTRSVAGTWSNVDSTTLGMVK